jgi:hypothetical protein
VCDVEPVRADGSAALRDAIQRQLRRPLMGEDERIVAGPP